MSQKEGPKWYAVQTRSRFERTVTKSLELKNIEYCCPAVREIHQWADRKKVVERPVFPGYVFVRIQDQGCTRLSVLQTPGAVRILGNSQAIEPIPDFEIASIQRLVHSGAQWSTHPFLTEGAWVRVRRGALKDVEGRLVRLKNQARVVLSVSLLSQSVSAEVDSEDLEIVRPSSLQEK